jgi:hypothetical protein
MNQKTTCPHCKRLFEVSSEAFNTVVSCPACNSNFNPMKEYVRASWELTKTPAFQASLESSIAEANAGITHDEFVTGMANRTMGFKVMQGEPYRLIKGFGKLFFNVLVMLYTVAPLFIIPFWAYHERKCWLLIGIVVASVISPQLEQLKPYSAGALFLCSAVGFWFFGGIHSYFTFFSLCSFWGCMFFRLAESAQIEYAIQALKESPELFYEAVAQNKIMIVRR